MTWPRAIGFVLIAAMAALGACGKNGNGDFQGWVEADMIFISADEQGRVETQMSREGDKVAKDSLLFTLDSDLQRADVMQNEATLANAQQALDRARELLKNKVGTQKSFDDAEALVRTAQARLNSSQTRLIRRRVVSPVDGVVQQVYYRPGETVSVGRPVVALLPPGNIKVRFFVPEAMLPKIAIGDTVHVTCDGCASDLVAKISFISRTNEFTPPVIYSLEERSKLVFMVEARPDKPETFRVGQPVSVELAPRETSR
ncbi:MAG: efflux RND transporter periplasmic adaptor subunit [Rhizobiales bacterium]|nr:efflux RND transporter periplasmic adaptor subunit [Hyphomicrobiales bacterium]